MFKITPKGFNNYTNANTCINIPFSSVKSCQDLKTKLESEYNLSNGILVYNYNTYSLPLYFDEGFSNDNMNINFINVNECVTFNVEYLDRSWQITTHINDNLFSAIYSVSFIIPNRRYNFLIDNKQINIYKKIQTIVQLNPEIPYYDQQNTITVVQVE